MIDKLLILAWILFLFIDGEVDFRKNILNRESPNHLAAFIYRSVAGVGLVLVSGFTWWAFGAFLALSWWFIFDSFMGWRMGYGIQYVGRISKIDLFQRRTLPLKVWWFFKLLLFIGAASNLYFYGYCSWEEINAGNCE